MESNGRTIRITARHELVAVCSAVGMLTIALFAPWIVPRVLLGAPLVLFLPGYTLLSALFPRKGEMDLLERLIIGAGFSLVMVTIIAFLINYTPLGLRLVPLFTAYSASALGASLVSYYRRNRLPPEERFEIVFSLKPPTWDRASRWNKVLSLALMASIVIAIGSISYGIASPKPGERFTELYVLGATGKASEYPQTINLGETATVTVGIVNHEQRAIPYRLVVLIGGLPTFTKDPILLDSGQSWEEAVPLSPVNLGKQQKVEINLYRPGDTQPYRFLILWVDVSEKGP